MIGWLRAWWARSAWQPDAGVAEAKDRRIEKLRRQAISARIDNEAVRVTIDSRLEAMRGSFERAEARLSRK